jgi:protein-S-isoprenylcysteine O-methyltransferase Ste14
VQFLVRRLKAGSFGEMRMRTGWWQGKRGEWYVIIQAVLFALVLLGPRTLSGLPAWPPAARLPALLFGAVLLLAGTLLAGAGAASLGRNLTPLPHPKDDAQLVESGAYRLVRHPIYSGIILMAFGWSLCTRSYLVIAYATLVFLFLDLKSRREERWLTEKFPGYDSYRKRVRKLIPFVY